MLRKLLCPTNFSEYSLNAIRYANELAQRMNSRMVLFHSLPADACPAMVAKGEELEEYQDALKEKEAQALESLKFLQSKLEECEWGLPISYTKKVKTGFAQNAILETAKEENIDLVVLGNKGNENLKNIFTASVAAEVIRQVSCPVLIVPRKAVFRPLRTILFATDLRGENFEDIAMVVQVARIFEARIIFLHVQTGKDKKKSTMGEGLKEQLFLRLPYKNISFETVDHPNVEEGIRLFARETQADMLVLGYHPQTFWKNLFSAEASKAASLPLPIPLLIFHYQK
jgi:nucleotide-binding universal stress UspA family protein